MSEILLFVVLGTLVSVWIVRRLSPWIEAQHRPRWGFPALEWAVKRGIPPELKRRYLDAITEALVIPSWGLDNPRRIIKFPVDTGRLRFSWRVGTFGQEAPADD